MKHATFKLTKRIILLILILSLALTGCAPTGEENVDPRDLLPDNWETGYKHVPFMSYMGEARLAAKGSRYNDVDNVQITLSYGHTARKSDGYVGEYPYRGHEVYIMDYVNYEWQKKFLLIDSEEDLFNENSYKYDATRTPTSPAWAYVDYNFNYSTTVSIPKEVFCGDSGWVYITLFSYHQVASEESRLTGILELYYMKLSDDKIMLTSRDEYIEYYKPKKDN